MDTTSPITTSINPIFVENESEFEYYSPVTFSFIIVFMIFNIIFIILLLVISFIYYYKNTTFFLVFFIICLIIIIAFCIGNFLMLDKYKKIDEEREEHLNISSKWHVALLAFGIINIIICIIAIIIGIKGFYNKPKYNKPKYNKSK